MKKWIRIGSIFMAIIVLLVVVVYDVVSFNASGRTFDDIGDVPPLKYGLLVATSPITPGGARNFYFDNRIKAADELYKSGKVDFIIVSGGNYTHSQKNGYDEPKVILDSLVARGVLADRIILDYEGTRTLNSIAKAKMVYGLDSRISPSKHQCSRIKNTLREYLARVKMFIDVANMSTNYVE